MSQKVYDLEQRAYEFAKECRLLLKRMPKTIINIEDGKPSGSVGANYIEANEALSKKDFCFRIKISRKEAKESKYWFFLLKATNPEFENELEKLIKEADELKKIFSAILEKSS